MFEVRVGAGADFESVSRRITERFNDLPRQLQRIARFALDAPEDFALGTAAQLAEMIGVQPSALVRFANAVGFDGFVFWPDHPDVLGQTERFATEVASAVRAAA